MQDINETSDTSSELTAAPGEPLAGPRTRSEKSKWTAAIAVSCLVHGAVAATLLMSPSARSALQDPAQTEGSDKSGANVVGSALNPEQSALNVAVVPPPPPPAKPLPPTKSPRPAETVKPQPTPEAKKPPAEPDIEVGKLATPAILATEAPRNDADSVMPDEKTPATAAIEPESAAPSPTPAQPPVPTARPVMASPREADEKSGAADGQNRSERTASKGKKQSEVGTSAEDSYRSDVIRKLGRVYRGVPPSVQATARSNTVVTFVIGKRGNIDELRVLESSGSESFDKLVLGFVRKAAPFPPIPAKVGDSLEFTGAIGPF
ncbi:TonB family protein [Mesorhizobium sp. ORS 3324]|nr:TonB family protein [Mesorhizobium sp. ORS 3324]